MDVKIYPSMLDGDIIIPSSKSMAHRMLIAASLADNPTRILLNGISEDVFATADALQSLGAKITPDGEMCLYVEPIKEVKGGDIDCRESGSTLRFMLPVCSALGASATFHGKGKLPKRPIKELLDVLNGVKVDGEVLPLSVSGKLKSGTFKIRGDVSSQYVTGLLFALPILDGDSEILIEGCLESKPYVDMTLNVLSRFKIEVKETENGYFVKGGQKYVSPMITAVEGDWSSASFFVLASAIGNLVRVKGVDANSLQGDKVVREMMLKYSVHGTNIDVKDCPDLTPVLAVAGCFAEGTTVITNASRLRLKESDRLNAITTGLKALGGKIEETADGLKIEGTKGLIGGECDSFGDHRIAMALAIAATKCKGETIIRGAECVSKSFPTFFDEFKRLGGKFDVL